MEDAKKAMERFDIKQQFQETEGSVCPCAHTLVLSLLHGEFAGSHALDTRIWASFGCVCHLSPSPPHPIFFLSIILMKVLSLSQDAQKL